MSPLILCILILALGLALIFLEMFIPSAGVLSVLAGAAILTAIVLAYIRCGATTGTLFTLATVVIVPLVVGVALRWYPDTPLGRLIIYQPPTPEEVTPSYDRSPDGQLLKGQIGKAKTPLLPGGSVKIEGTTYDATSEGEPIERGEIVLVVRAEGKHLVVRKVSGELSEGSSANTDETASAVNSLDIDPFEDPLG